MHEANKRRKTTRLKNPEQTRQLVGELLGRGTSIRTTGVAKKRIDPEFEETSDADAPSPTYTKETKIPDRLSYRKSQLKRSLSMTSPET